MLDQKSDVLPAYHEQEHHNCDDKNGRWQHHSGNKLADSGEHSVIDCEQCGFAHIIPLPSAAEKADFYQNEFYETFSDDYIAKHQEDWNWWRLEHIEKYELFESLLTCETNEYSILDVGSGPGTFLKTGAERDWHVEGIEPGASAWKYSSEQLGLKVHHAYLDENNVDKFGRFDVVHLNNVLEHIVDAGSFVKMVRKLLNKNGLIAITVPNDFNPLQEAVVECLKKPEWWVSPLQHINYFSGESLARCLAQRGYETVKTTGSFPLEIFALMGMDYIGNGQLGRSIHEQRKLFELNLEKCGKTPLKRKIYDALSQLDIGRQVTVVARIVEPFEDD